MLARRLVGRRVAAPHVLHLHVPERAIDLVCAGEDDWRTAPCQACGFEHVERAAGVRLEIVRRLLEAGGYRRLRRKVKHGLGVSEGSFDRAEVADIGDQGLDGAAVAVHQPFEVSLDAGTAEIVENDHVLAVAQKAVGEIAAEKAAAAYDQDRRRLAGKSGRRQMPVRADGPAAHRTSPRASRWRFISAPRSIAPALRTHWAKSASESSSRWIGSKPRRSRALGYRRAIADIPGAGLVHDLRLDFGDTHRFGKQRGDVRNGVGVAAAYIDDVAGGVRLFERQPEGTRHVADMHEVAFLPAVLEDHRRLPVGKPGSEVGKHAGIGVGKAWPAP